MNKYTSISQFRTVNKYVSHVSKVTNTVKPKITFEGTVKLHGTNTGVKISKDGIITIQSRNNEIDINNDHFGFSKFIEESKEELIKAFKKDVDVVIYGEWCGRGIQKKIALSELEKMWVIFDYFILKDDHDEEEEQNKFVNNSFIKGEGLHNFNSLNEKNIYSIYQFPVFNIEIDFSNPIQVENKVQDIIELVQNVEDECPVGKHFGVSGIGEGLVFKPVYYPENMNPISLYFKAKGEKHSPTKVKKLVQVDTEELATVMEFIEYAVTENRVQQAIHELGISEEVSIERFTGDVIKWVISDIFKEELDTIATNELDKKMFGKYAPNAIKEIFFKHFV